MRKRLLFTGLLLAALAAVMVPPWFAWREARVQAYAAEAGLTLDYARAMLRWEQSLTRQALAGIAELSRSGLEPCSAEGRALMQRIDLTSTFIKAIGHVRGGVLQCSSMHDEPFPLGKHLLRTSDGLAIYSNVPVGGVSPSPLMALERDGFAVLFHSDLQSDASSGIAGLSQALLHLERRPEEPVAMARGFIDRAWVRRLGDRSEVTFIDGQYLVAVVRSSAFPSAGVAALPLSRLQARRDALASRLVPAGVITGSVLAAALLLLARRRTSLTTSLQKALSNDEFFLLYQPVVDLRSGQWIGAEALVRWRRATGELIGPDLFIPLAEQTGMITRLTGRILELVERDTRHFLAAHPGFHVAVNLSASDLHSDAIVRQFDAMLARGGIQASNLVVEITERGILDIQAARPVIGALRARGFVIAIDDFGTGYAGLSYLEALHVDFLKIDRSFVEAIGTGAPTKQVVDHIIAMAKGMRLRMVAEGIETQAQADYLRARGVEFAQGWLFGKPQPFADIAAALASAPSAVARQPGSATMQG